MSGNAVSRDEAIKVLKEDGEYIKNLADFIDGMEDLGDAEFSKDELERVLANGANLEVFEQHQKDVDIISNVHDGLIEVKYAKNDEERQKAVEDTSKKLSDELIERSLNGVDLDEMETVAKASTLTRLQFNGQSKKDRASCLGRAIGKMQRSKRLRILDPRSLRRKFGDRRTGEFVLIKLCDAVNNLNLGRLSRKKESLSRFIVLLGLKDELAAKVDDAPFEEGRRALDVVSGFIEA